MKCHLCDKEAAVKGYCRKHYHQQYDIARFSDPVKHKARNEKSKEYANKNADTLNSIESLQKQVKELTKQVKALEQAYLLKPILARGA